LAGKSAQECFGLIQACGSDFDRFRLYCDAMSNEQLDGVHELMKERLAKWVAKEAIE
jgi:hypothetical protein